MGLAGNPDARLFRITESLTGKTWEGEFALGRSGSTVSFVSSGEVLEDGQ